MKIIKNIEESTVNFGSLKVGDVFLADEHICMKIPKVYNDFSGADTEALLEGCMDAEDFYQHEVNAYDLEDNMFFWIDEDDQVKLCKAHVEVK